MGLFNKLGRKFGELKAEADEAKARQATHRCATCEELLFGQREECSECGADAVVEIDYSD
jgi:uncharacterized OB-fold protein